MINGFLKRRFYRNRTKKNQIYCLCVILNACASATRNPAMIGGSLVDQEHSFPSNVLFVDNSIVCGGVVIGLRHILTAAHCVYKKINDRAQLTVRESLEGEGGFVYHLGYNDIGKLNGDDPDGLRQVMQIHFKKVHVHPTWIKSLNSGDEMNAWRDSKNSWDLAVVETVESLPVPIARVSKRKIEQFERVVQTGSGCNLYGAYSRSPLRFAVKEVSFYEISQFMFKSDRIDRPGKAAVCAGDSGSPVYSEQLPNTVVGLIHANGRVTALNPSEPTGFADEKARFPDIDFLTRVDTAQEWIHGVVDPDYHPKPEKIW